jgi:hypothetical protein
MNQQERERLLLEAIGDAVQQRRTTEAEERNAKRQRERQRHPALAWAGFVLGWALLGWIWVGRPAWVFGPDAPPQPTAEVAEARLRFALYLERGRVDGYRARHGRLPGVLSDAGPLEAGVEYLPVGAQFTLVGRSAGMELRLSSRMDSDSFLGRSRDLLNAKR